MKSTAVRTLFLLAAFAAFAACGSAAAAPSSLYDQLGAAAGVRAISSELIDRVAADPRIGASFQDVNLKRVKKLLATQLCELSGGPCRYTGDSMREVHAGLGITEADFYGMVAILRDIMRRRGVPIGARNALLGLLAPMKRDVVEVALPPPR
ncbi:MAG: group 1 truncated hemoglobin [Gammaproteobacteria bacterium]|nr:group 1 truncated hemoglobin [Gammaproteobacteria bacterium]